MPCLLAMLALAMPRVVILLLWFLTGWFRGVFDTLLWPIVGVIVALLIDLSPARGRRSDRRRA